MDDNDISLQHLELVPEIPLYLGKDGIVGMWEKYGRSDGSAPPYWAYAWPGGQALARYTLEHPDIVRGSRVLDFGSGSGINTIPAVLAGATNVTACDNVTQSRDLTALNCELHVLPVEKWSVIDWVTENHLAQYDVILMGDGFYDPEMTGSVLALFDQAIDQGIEVYVGDPRREYLPERRCEKLAEYTVPNMMNLERRNELAAFVYRLRSNAE